MSRDPLEPPRWPARLLSWTLPSDTIGRSVKADLDQEYRERVKGRSGWPGPWYSWEALKLAARYGVRDVFGGLVAVCQSSRGVRFALRQIRRTPGFSALAVTTLALGIGATVTIFSLVNAVLLEPLPYPDSHRLVVIYEWNQPRDRQNNVANPGNFRAWRDRSASFESMTAVSMVMPATVTAAGDPDEAMVRYANPDYFQVLGMTAQLGRVFSVSSVQEGDQVVLGHRYWQRRFGGDPDVVGATVQVNGTPAVVVGIAPDDYVAFGEGTDLWMAMDVARGDQTNSGRWLYVVGRLNEGVSITSARRELEGVAAGLQEEFPDFNAGWTVNLLGLKEDVIGDVREALWILMGAVGLLLVIACVNVANLFLVRATERQKEMAVRSSLGASKGRLAGQLLSESLTLAGVGSLLGVLIAYIGTEALVLRVPEAFDLPRVDGAGVDGTVLLFAVGLSVATGVIFGLVPALRAGGASPAAALNAESRDASRGTSRLRHGLVTVEVAVSVVLLAGAALFGRSLVELLAVDPGIQAGQVVVGRVTLSGGSYASGERQVEFFQRLRDRLEAQPGVEEVGGVTFLPMDGPGAATGYYPLDRPAPRPEDRPVADIRNVDGDYFGAMGIPLLQGRLFDTRDGPDGPRTAVVNRTLADTNWPNESAVGKPLYISWETDEPWEIVGIVEDVRLVSLDQAPRATIYLSYPRTPYFNWLQVVLRTSADLTILTETLRREVQALDPALPVGSIRIMQDVVDRSAARPRMTAFLMVLFASLATLLAAVGLYGVLAYAVSKRTRELGVRVAMGARPGDILTLVVRQGVVLVSLGLVVGLALTLAAGRLVTGLLYQIRPSDPVALGGAGLVVFVVALFACMTPAVRACRTPPAEALKSE